MAEDNFNNEIPESHSPYVPKNDQSISKNPGEGMTENDSKPQNEVSLNKVYSQKIRHLSNSQKISYLNGEIK